MCDIENTCGFLPIKNSNLGEKKLSKGKNICISGHVNNVKEVKRGDVSLLKAEVIRQTSVNLPPYQVTLEIDGERNIISRNCPCPAGLGYACKHIAAVIYYVNNEQITSKTDIAQTWGKPSSTRAAKEKYSKGKRISEIFSKKELKYSVAASPCELDTIVNIACPLYQMLQAENRTEEERDCKSVINYLLESVESSVLLDECKHITEEILQNQCNSLTTKLAFRPLNEGEQSFYENYVSVSNEKALNISVTTLKQSECSEWFTERKLRISASNKAHRIKVGRRESFDSLANTFLVDSNKILVGVAARNVKYGKDMESEAIANYQRTYDTKVLRCGLIIHKLKPWLCGSPDGIVVSGGKAKKVLEVKCPISCKDKYIMDETGNITLKYLILDERGNITLKKNNIYYTQCQMLMYVTGVDTCDLYVYSRKQQICITLEKNLAYTENCIDKIETFYFTHYLPTLVSDVKYSKKCTL